MNAANAVRPIMDQIIALSKKFKFAFIIVMHLSKATTQAAVDRTIGTTDFKAAARRIVYRITNEGLKIEGFSEMKADDIVNPYNYAPP